MIEVFKLCFCQSLNLLPLTVLQQYFAIQKRKTNSGIQETHEPSSALLQVLCL